MNLEESDALVGIGFLQMPTTRGGLYASTLTPSLRVDQLIESRSGDWTATTRLEVRLKSDRADLNVPLMLFCELRGRKNCAGPHTMRAWEWSP